MEEILASIRRIISEDEAPAEEAEAAPAAEAAAPAAEPEPEPEPPPAPEPVAAAPQPEPEPEPEPEEEALELTEKVESHGDLDGRSCAPSAGGCRKIGCFCKGYR